MNREVHVLVLREAGGFRRPTHPGETVRQAQGEFRDFGEPILDWFHVAMRTTQLTQSIKGLAADPPIEGDSPNRIEELLRELNRAKAYLWHGSPHRALRTLEDLTWEIGAETPRATATQDKLVMTQELIANMLGVRREGVTEGALKLQHAGLIQYARGHITVLDRAGLEERSCECYAVVKKEYDRLLPVKLAT